ncbi:MAG: glycogen synthase [Chlamydiales bacterium]
MKIFHICSECAPFAKAGGMADALLGLLRETKKLGHDVQLILPKYRFLKLDELRKLDTLNMRYDHKECVNQLWSASYEEIPLLLIEPKTSEAFFERDHIYGEPDDVERFSYFAKAAASYLERLSCSPDVIHLHDWHASLVPALYKKALSILTIHNLGYPGVISKESLEKLEIPDWEIFRCRDYYSLLQGGIISADQITTVSPAYSKEILQPESGGDFCHLLHHYQEKLVGILNGIDYTYWNPQSDPLIPYHYNSTQLEGKKETKKFLQKRLQLEEKECILVGAVTRLVEQKGPRLIKSAVEKTVEAGGQFLLLGSAQDSNIRALFSELQTTLAPSRSLHIELQYNEELAHHIFAASDLFIVPSIFEPCGLTQMIAMRYGTVPLVRATGGLGDTVFEEKNGFLFGPPEEAALHHALTRAFACWRNAPEKWDALKMNGMREDFSWREPARKYLALYDHKLYSRKK